MEKWTKEEVDFLIKHYPTEGSIYCAEKLDRSKTAIVCKASKLKVKEQQKDFKILRKGEKHTTNEGYEVEIIECFNYNNYTVKFKNGAEIKNVQYSRLLLGNISNPYHKSVFGVGYFGEGEYLSRVNKEKTKAYITWINVLRRCYNEKERNKYPSYKDVIVCEEWKCFQNFAEWFENNYIEDFHLDKDIICKDCKIYSPETCAFVPQEINKLFTLSEKTRGVYPIGVICVNTRFIAQVSINNKRQKYLGAFNTPEEAFQVYKTAKEDYIKEVADKWRGQITEQVYQAMYNYQIETAD